MGPASSLSLYLVGLLRIREGQRAMGHPVQAGGVRRVNGEQGGDGTRKEEDVPQGGGALPVRGLPEKKRARLPVQICTGW